MHVFKLIWKIILSKYKEILVSFAYLLILIPLVLGNQSESKPIYGEPEVKMAIFNHDDHPISNYLERHLKGRMDVVEIEEDIGVLLDSFYEEKISYALTIPQGFGEEFLNGKEAILDKQVGWGKDKDVMLVEEEVGKLLRTLSILAEVTEGDKLDQALESADKIMDYQGVGVEIEGEDTNLFKLKIFGTIFLGFLSYILIMNLINQFGRIFLATKKEEIVTRDKMAMISKLGRNLQIFLALALFCILYWCLGIGIGIGLTGLDLILSQRGLAFILLSFVNLIGIIGLIYLVSNLAKSEGQLAFLATSLSLLISFISGSFVPIQFIGEFPQAIAQFFPVIWQLRSANLILNQDYGGQLATYMGIQILMGLAYMSIGILIERKKLLSKS